MINIDLNEYAKKIYKQNCDVGWWDNCDRCIFETLQLVSTEVAECTEGERKDLMDDHLPRRKMAEVELADTLIRVLDLGWHLGLNFNGIKTNTLKSYANKWCNKSNSIGKQHLGINSDLLSFSHSYDDAEEFREVGLKYDILICSILLVAKNSGYDIIGAMDEKLEYNKTRSDHKRENREKANGKKF